MQNKNSSLITLTRDNEALLNSKYEEAIRHYNSALAQKSEPSAMLQSGLDPVSQYRRYD